MQTLDKYKTEHEKFVSPEADIEEYTPEESKRIHKISAYLPKNKSTWAKAENLAGLLCQYCKDKHICAYKDSECRYRSHIGYGYGSLLELLNQVASIRGYREHYVILKPPTRPEPKQEPKAPTAQVKRKYDWWKQHKQAWFEKMSSMTPTEFYESYLKGRRPGTQAVYLSYYIEMQKPVEERKPKYRVHKVNHETVRKWLVDHNHKGSTIKASKLFGVSKRLIRSIRHEFHIPSLLGSMRKYVKTDTKSTLPATNYSGDPDEIAVQT